ncbi:hypothetical protein [Escherichia phage PJNS034]
MAATNKRLEVALPYRRGFITANDLTQSVADVMAEFDKLEIAIDELMRLSSSGGDPAAIEALKEEIKKLWEAINKLNGTELGDIGKQVDEVKKQLDAISTDEDALTKKLSEFLREDISHAQDEVVNQLLKETNEAREALKESQTKLSEQISNLNKSATEAQEKWDNIGADGEALQGIKDALSSDIAEKVKAGDDLVLAQLAAFQQVVTEQDKATATQIEGVKSQSNTNKADIEQMKQTITTDKESTAQKIDNLETKYTNVNDTANQAFVEAKKAGEMAMNSTEFMKTYNMSTAGAPHEEVASSSREAAAPEFFGVRELREETVLSTAKPGINLVVINRKTQERTGAYNWSFNDGDDAKWVQDFKDRVASFNRDYLQMVYTYQYAGEFLPKLKESLIALGGTEIGIDSVAEGGSYALMGYDTIPAGQGMEHVGRPEMDGKINVTTSMYRDQLTGLDGFTATQFQEIEDRINSQAERFEKEVQLANTRITDESKARSDAMGSLATQLSGVEAKANHNEAAIKEQTQTQADALKAVTEKVSGAESRIGETIAKVTELESTVTTKMDAAVKKVDSMDSRVAGNESKIQAESEARSTAILAISKQVEAMQSTVNDNDASVQALKKTVADSTSSLAQRVDNLVASVDSASKAGVNNALNLDSQSKTIAQVTTDVKATADKANATATQVSGLSTRLGTAEGSINDVKKSVSTLDGNVTSRLNSLESTVNTSVKAQIAALEKVVTAKDTAMASRVSSVDAKVNANTSRITNEVKTLTDKTNALTSQANTLQTDLNGTKTTLQQVSSVASSANNKHEALWAVRSNVAGVPAGFGLINGGANSAFVVDADRFIVRNRDSKNSINPFEIINGTVRIKTAYIDTAAIVNLAAQQINVKNLNGATITGSNINGGNINGTNITGGTLNISNRMKVESNGNILIQDNTAANRGLKISNNAIRLYDNAGVLRVQISL